MSFASLNPFVRNLAIRAVRNAVQVLVPFALLAATGHITGVDILNGAAAAGLAAGLSVLKTLAGLHADATAPRWVQGGERALAAAAGAVVAVWPLDLAGALSASWVTIGVAAAGAAAVSGLTFVVEATEPADPDAEVGA